MSVVGIRDAKAGLSRLVDQAASGAFITITRYEKPVAVLVSVEVAEAGRKTMLTPRLNFGDFLLTYPGGVALERNPIAMRVIDLE